MYKKSIVLYDTRVEMSTKYKKSIEQNEIAQTTVTHSFEETVEKIKTLEPELILVSDSVKDNINDFCLKIRKIGKDLRPVVIVLSKSSYLEDKLSSLNSGADDFLSEPMDINEFLARINAHLRRQNEESSSLITKLPLSIITYRVLKRIMETDSHWALLYIDIDNLTPYRELYGEIASNKMLQAYTAILNSVTNKNDFLGQINDENFVIITSPVKAERLADCLNMAFDSVASRFYNEEDSKKGYIILHGDSKAGRKTPLVSTSIGLISSEHKKYTNYKEAMNAVISLHKLAKLIPGSSKVIDRPQLCGFEQPKEKELKRILIVETDAALAYLLSTTLEMENYQTEATGNYDEVLNKIAVFKPHLVLMEAGSEEPQKGLEICQKIKKIKEFANIKIIISTIIHNKENVLDAGADLYLPKPYELRSLFNWIAAMPL
ncbi:MAG: response regulator [Candidatus Gastranaerophilaceae bacterium]|jgi:DNA-binding response OmpR family regulator